MINLMVAKNSFGVNNLLGVAAYVLASERGESIKWYSLSLKFRKSKHSTPFQHAESAFLRRPSVFQLQSILHGLTAKKSHYGRIARREVEGRDLLLSSIPAEYHRKLFPWYTPEVLQLHRENQGISVRPKGIYRRNTVTESNCTLKCRNAAKTSILPFSNCSKLFRPKN